MGRCRRRRRDRPDWPPRAPRPPAGARTIVLERAEHPRYKTCGGGLIGASRAAAGGLIDVPARDEIRRATITLRGGQEFTRSHGEPMLAMVVRDEFDAALLKRAEENGARLRQRTQVRAIDQADGHATARLADGTEVAAKVIIGADGSSGVTARHVGATVRPGGPRPRAGNRRAGPGRGGSGRAGYCSTGAKIPASYGWVFPKGDRLTVGVIAERGHGRGHEGVPARVRRPAWPGRRTRRSRTPATSPAAARTAHRCARAG